MVLLIKITEAWKQRKYRDPAWCLRRRHPATQNISPTSKSSHLSQISRIISERKVSRVEKFQISVDNLNNLWSFIEIYAILF